MNRHAHKSLTAANASADRARAALRVFLATPDESEAERIHDDAVVEREAAADAATEAYNWHRSKALWVASYESEDSGWWDAHCAWDDAAKAWDQIPDAWET